MAYREIACVSSGIYEDFQQKMEVDFQSSETCPRAQTRLG